MPAEFFKDMDIDEYHSKTEYLSKSMISKFADCPQRYKHLYIDGGEQKQSKSLRLGSAVHVLALEPELWKAGYHILPETYFNSKGEEAAMKRDSRMEVYRDQLSAAGYDVQKNDVGKWEIKDSPRSKVILSKTEYDTVEQMANGLLKNTFAVSLLKSPGYVESSIFWEAEHEDDESGEIVQVKKRCRPDLLRNDALAVDLKTCRSSKPDIFFRDAENFHYDLSAAMTDEGYQALHDRELDDYVFVAVESEAPYITSCFDVIKPMDDFSGLSYLDFGRIRYNKLIQSFIKCKATDTWPGYVTQIEPMSIPGWRMKQFLEKGI